MQLSQAQLEEHDEILPEVTSSKGDKCIYKVNHKTKQVWIRTGENDGNEKEWRHTGGSYNAVMALVGRNSSGQPVGNVAPVSSIEPVDPFGRTLNLDKE